MKLKISAIENRGDIEKERIVLKALDDLDVGHYLIFKTKKVGDGISARLSDAFWFQDKQVKKNDWVVLYTKSGTYKSSAGVTGATSHFFYWDKTVPLWKGEDNTAVLLHADEWNVHEQG